MGGSSGTVTVLRENEIGFRRPDMISIGKYRGSRNLYSPGSYRTAGGYRVQNREIEEGGS